MPGGGLTSGRGALLTSYGRVSSDWTLASGVFTLTVTVPVNTTASVTLPLTPNVATDVRRDGAAVTAETDGSYSVGSGTYVFTTRSL
jgi:alpha-L-rhamnosidase